MKEETLLQLKEEQGSKRWHLGRHAPKRVRHYGLASPHIYSHRIDCQQPQGYGVIIGSEGRECAYWKHVEATVYELSPNLEMVRANNKICKNTFTVKHLDDFVEEQVDWIKIVVNEKTQSWIMRHWDWIITAKVVIFFVETAMLLPLEFEFDSRYVKIWRSKTCQDIKTAKRKLKRRAIAEVKPFINIIDIKE